MPIFPGDAFGIGVGMDGQNLGMSLRTGRVRVNVQVAKIAAERLVTFLVERLIAKEQNLMLRQRLVQLLDLAVAERLGERQAVDLGANARRNRRPLVSMLLLPLWSAAAFSWPRGSSRSCPRDEPWTWTDAPPRP